MQEHAEALATAKAADAQAGKGKGNGKGGAPDGAPGSAHPAGAPRDALPAGDDRLSAAERNKLNDARHCRFRRDMNPPTGDSGRQAKGNRCPPELAAKIRAATQNNPAESQEYCRFIGECLENWAQVEIHIDIREGKRKEDKNNGRWMSERDLVDKYKDPATVAKIIKGKKDKNLWTPNPDCPEIESEYLYECSDKRTSEDTTFSSSEQSKRLTANMSAATANILQGFLPNGPSGSSSARPSSASGGSSQPSNSGQPSDTDPAKVEKERKEIERKEKIEREKREREIHKNKPLTKAAAWATGMVKNIGIAQTWINEIERSNLPADTTNTYKVRMTKQLDILKALQLELERAKTDGSARIAVDKAPVAEINLKEEIKVRKKVHKALTGK